MKTRDRAPGLDGVRALAVLTVIAFHEGASGLPGGFLGVDIFFVLSGFLITDLLVARYDRTGRLATRRARVACALTGAAVSALVMTIQYTPGGDPSAVYYGTGTHASALLIGAALALSRPLRALTAIPAAHSRRLDMGGIAGLVVLAWAAGHFSGSDPVVYPVGLLLAAFGAAGLGAPPAGPGGIPPPPRPGPLPPGGAQAHRVSP